MQRLNYLTSIEVRYMYIYRGEIYVYIYIYIYIYKACSKCLKHIKKNSMKLKHTPMD